MKEIKFASEINFEEIIEESFVNFHEVSPDTFLGKRTMKI